MTTTETKPQATAADWHLCAFFISPAQMRAIRSFSRGEEGDFFKEKIAEIAGIIRAMPKTGETDGTEDPVAHLHYFAGGQANFWITEKDAGSPDDAPQDKGVQHQAFGKADLFGDGGELGYISLPEIFSGRGELDLYWKPKPLSECGN